MSKKLILTCMAVAAFTLPATASASPRLCETQADHTTCNNLAVGTKAAAHNVGNIILRSGDPIVVTCSTAYLTLTVTSNTGSHLAWNLTTAHVGGSGPPVSGEAEPECTGTFGNVTVDMNLGNGTPWCLTDGSDTFTVRGNECSKEARSITFVLTSTTVGSCRYSRVAPITGTMTTDLSGTQDAVLHEPASGNEFTKEEGSIFCPSTLSFELSLTLETDVDSNATKTTNTVTAPLYIK